MTKPTTCKACNAEIVFRLPEGNPAGRLNPINTYQHPTIKGDIEVLPDGTYRKLGPLEAAAHPGPLYLSHFVDCANADRFRAIKWGDKVRLTRDLSRYHWRFVIGAEGYVEEGYPPQGDRFFWVRIGEHKLAVLANSMERIS